MKPVWRVWGFLGWGLFACASPPMTETNDDASTGVDPAAIELPLRLSDTGLYQELASRTLSDGVRSFEVQYPLWSDGADKSRYLYLPPGSQIDTSDMDNWVFPIGTKAWKEFRRDGVLVETRLIWKQADGEEGWVFGAYLWDDAESDALLAVDGLADARGTEHDVPDQAACFNCHRGASDFLLGVAALQLSQPSGVSMLDELAAMDRLTINPVGSFTAPGDQSMSALLGYFHGNCGHCHGNHHPLSRIRSLRLVLSTSDLDANSTPAVVTSVGVLAGHDLSGVQVIVEPGSPEKSQLYYRMARRDTIQMPPLGTEVVDEVALARVRDWIRSL